MIFGDGRRAHAKWIAATRILADPEAEAATYIDVRLPGRPAAGGTARLDGDAGRFGWHAAGAGHGAAHHRPVGARERDHSGARCGKRRR